MKHTQIAIIGAGVAGLAAASQLLPDSYQLFEKSRGPGGRLASKRIDSMRVDIGAQFFTVRDPAFAACVEHAMALHYVAEWTPRVGVFRKQQPISSPDQQTRYVGRPYMNSFSKYLSKNIDVNTGWEVDSIVRKDSKFLVTKADGSAYTADKVLITAPINQMLNMLCDFDLELISRRFAMAATWTAVVASNAQLKSNDGGPLDAVFGGDHPTIDFITSEVSKPSRESNLIVIHSKPNWAQDNLEKTSQEICADFSQQLSDIFKIQCAPVLAHRWRFARPLDPKISTQKGIYKVEKGLWIAGDYLAGGRVEGAFLAGREAGQRIRAD